MAPSETNPWLDHYVDADGELYYPEFSRERIMALEILLDRAKIKSNLIRAALVHDARNVFPSDCCEPPDAPLTAREICLLIARLRANDISYHPALRAVVPDYNKKTKILSGQDEGLDFYPLTYLGLHGKWGAKSNVVFQNVKPLSAPELTALMEKAYCHPPQDEPKFGIAEMANFKMDYGSTLKLPIFSPYVTFGKQEDDNIWQALADENYLPSDPDSWKDRKAPTGTNFVAVCKNDFFEKTLKL